MEVKSVLLQYDFAGSAPQILEKIAGFTDDINANLFEYEKRVKAFERANKPIKDQTKILTGYDRTLIDVLKDVDKLAKETDDYTEELTELNKALKDVNTSQSKLTKGSKGYKILGEQAEVLNSRISQIKNEVRGASKSLDNFETKSKGFGSNASKGINLIKGAFKAFIAFEVVQRIIPFLKNAVGAAAELESSFNSLQAITGLSGQAFEGFKVKAKEVAAETNLTAAEIAEAFSLVGSATPELLKSADALGEVTKRAILLSKAGGLDLNTSVDVLTKSLNQFQKGADSAAKFTDILATSQQKGTARIADLGETLKVAGGLANSAGLSFEEFNAITQAFAKGGRIGSEAGTLFKSALSDLNKEGFNLKNGFLPIIDELIKQNVTFENSQGRFSETGQDAIITLIAQRDQLAALSGNLNDVDSALNQAETNQKGLEKAQNRYNAAVNRLSVSIGEKLLPVYTKLLNVVADVAGEEGKARRSILQGIKDIASELLGFNKELTLAEKKAKDFNSSVNLLKDKNIELTAKLNTKEGKKEYSKLVAEIEKNELEIQYKLKENEKGSELTDLEKETIELKTKLLTEESVEEYNRIKKQIEANEIIIQIQLDTDRNTQEIQNQIDTLELKLNILDNGDIGAAAEETVELQNELKRLKGILSDINEPTTKDVEKSIKKLSNKEKKALEKAQKIKDAAAAKAKAIKDKADAKRLAAENRLFDELERLSLQFERNEINKLKGANKLRALKKLADQETDLLKLKLEEQIKESGLTDEKRAEAEAAIQKIIKGLRDKALADYVEALKKLPSIERLDRIEFDVNVGGLQDQLAKAQNELSNFTTSEIGNDSFNEVRAEVKRLEDEIETANLAIELGITVPQAQQFKKLEKAGKRSTEAFKKGAEQAAKDQPFSLLGALGFNDEEKDAINTYLTSIGNNIKGFLTDQVNNELEFNARLIEAYDTRIENLQDALDIEEDRKAAGEAESFDKTKESLDSQLALRDAALAERERLERKQARLNRIATLAQIVTDTASSISSLTKASAANPTNAATAGIAGALQFAAGIIQILAAIAQAKAVLSSAPSFRKGGLFEYGYTGAGHPDSESQTLGAKPYTYHKNEYISHDEATKENFTLLEGLNEKDKAKIKIGIQKLIDKGTIKIDTQPKLLNENFQKIDFAKTFAMPQIHSPNITSSLKEFDKLKSFEINMNNDNAALSKDFKTMSSKLDNIERAIINKPYFIPLNDNMIEIFEGNKLKKNRNLKKGD